MNQHYILGLDPGFDGFKLAEVTPEGLKTAYLLAVVGIGDTAIGLLFLAAWASAATGIRPTR